MQINQANLTALFKGYRTLYMDAYQGCAPLSAPLFQMVPSNAKSEQYNWLGAVPGMKRFRGEVQIENLAAEKWQIDNDEWENTVSVPQFDIETDCYGVYNPRFSALGIAAQQHKDELAGDLLIGGFDNLCYTGSNFFADNQTPLVGGTTFTNVSTAQLSQSSYRAARQRLKGRLNAKGRAMGLGLRLLLVVPPELESTARTIIIADTAIQAQNPGAVGSAVAAVTNVDKGTAELLVLPQLASQSDTAWFLLEVGYPIKPFAWQVNKEPILISQTNPESDAVFTNHVFKYQAYGRYNAGYFLPELAEGSDGTAAGGASS
jgi:phage major head subunit gpT-like protein